MSTEIVKVDATPLARTDAPAVILGHGNAARYAYFEDFLSGNRRRAYSRNYHRAADPLLA